MSTHLPLHYPAACPDCPGARLGVLEELVGATRHTCDFETGMVEAGSLVPSAWSARFAFGFARRGVLIRQRMDNQGRSTAIDAVGPGGLFPIPAPESDEANSSCDYAATDFIACLCPRDNLERVLERSTETARELLGLHQMALSRVERLARARGAPTANERVSALIGALADTLSPPRTRERLPAELKQRDLSTLIGVRHETFCRVLGRLERQGAIRRENDGLLIVDRDKLDAL